MENSSRYNDNYLIDFESRLKYIAERVSIRIDRILVEFLRGHYPCITSKEFAICKKIASTLWDLGDTPYIEILARVKDDVYNPFENAEDIENTIRILTEKGIVRSQTKLIQFGCRRDRKLRHEKVLELRDDIEAEAYQIISKEFDSIVTQAFFDNT
jgi:hypothetical protein